MPETRGERVFFAAGLVAIALLVALIAWERESGDPPTRPPAAAERGPGAPTTYPRPSSSTVTTNPQPAETSTAQHAQAPAAPTLTRLRLTARSDTWMSVHRTSKTGPILFEGTLPGGQSRTFSGASLSVRFGAAANVEAMLNGRSLPLPGGTYSVEIGSTGLGPRSA